MDKPRSKKWMYYDRVSKEYLDGVENFLNYAFRERETISCPCSQCVLYYQINRATAYDHLVVNGVMPSHDTLFCHGESLNESNSTHVNNYRQLTTRGDDMRGMIHDVSGGFTQSMDSDISERGEMEPNSEENNTNPSINQSHPEVDKFEQLLKDSNEELYPGCKKFNKLSFLLHLYNMKWSFKWTNESFNALLGLLKDALPEGEKLPPSFCETKKILEVLGLKYKKMHACPNDCMLFKNEFASKNVNKCLICGASRWKKLIEKSQPKS